MTENSNSEQNATPATGPTTGASSRRQLLKVGAIAAPAVLTLKPGHAWAASFNCTVRVPYIFQDTTTGAITPVLPIDSEPGATPPGAVLVNPPRVTTGRFYIGNEIVTGPIPDAHTRYLSTVQAGQGLTCLQSIGFIR